MTVDLPVIKRQPIGEPEGPTSFYESSRLKASKSASVCPAALCCRSTTHWRAVPPSDTSWFATSKGPATWRRATHELAGALGSLPLAQEPPTWLPRSPTPWQIQHRWCVSQDRCGGTCSEATHSRNAISPASQCRSSNTRGWSPIPTSCRRSSTMPLHWRAPDARACAR